MEKANIHANRRTIVNYSIIQGGVNNLFLTPVNEPNFIMAGDTKTIVVKSTPKIVTRVVII